jgi:carbonic anhydrase
MLHGNRRFVNGQTVHPHQEIKRLAVIEGSQHPMAAILSCADSRAPPEIIFDLGFGDLFTCRVAGNLATPEELASLEYAVIECGVKVIMVMGHTNCGAVKAALSGKAFPGFIDSLVDNLDVAVTRAWTRAQNHQAGESGGSFQAMNRALKHGKRYEYTPSAELVDLVIKENILYQMERIGRSPTIASAIDSGSLLLIPCLYKLRTGVVEIITEGIDESSGSRRPRSSTDDSSGSPDDVLTL